MPLKTKFTVLVDNVFVNVLLSTHKEIFEITQCLMGIPNYDDILVNFVNHILHFNLTSSNLRWETKKHEILVVLLKSQLQSRHPIDEDICN